MLSYAPSLHLGDRGSGSGRDTGAGAAGLRNSITLAVILSILRQNLDIFLGPSKEGMTEINRLLKATLNVVSTEGTEAVVGAALGSLGTLLACELDNKGATFDGVDEDVTRLEVGIAGPGADEGGKTVADFSVILGVNVDEGGLANIASSGVLGDRAGVENAETSTVIGLVDEVIDNVLVVIDGLDLGLVETGLLGVLEVADIPNIGDRESVFGGSVPTDLIKLVIEDEEFLVVDVNNGALVGVAGTLV